MCTYNSHRRSEKSTLVQTPGLKSAISGAEKSASSKKLEELLRESQAKAAAREKARIETINSHRPELNKPAELTPPRPQARDGHAPLNDIKKNFKETKPQTGSVQQLNNTDEKFAWASMDVALSTAPALTSTAPKVLPEPIPEVNDDEDVAFSWSPIGSPEAKAALVPNATPQFPIPTSPITATDNASEGPSTIPDDIPIPGTPKFYPNLKNILQKKNRKNVDEEAEKKKAAAKSKKIEKQKAERRRQAKENAAEKKKQQILAEAGKNGITITADSLRAQVELFMEKREVSSSALGFI